MKIKNIAIEIRLELDAFENMSVSVACRLELADTLCYSLVLFKKKADCSFSEFLPAATFVSVGDSSPSRKTDFV